MGQKSFSAKKAFLLVNENKFCWKKHVTKQNYGQRNCFDKKDGGEKNFGQKNTGHFLGKRNG